MKKALLATLWMVIIVCVYGQETDPVKWESVRLKKKQDYKDAEPIVKECVSYLLSHPYRDDDLVPRCAARLMLRWTEGTKDYTFTILTNISQFDPDGSQLLVIYIAALVREGFENPEILKDTKAEEVGAFKVVAEYCEKPENNVKMTPEIKKLIQANKDGKLASILDLETSKKKK